MSTSAENEIVQEPSMAKNSSPSRAPKIDRDGEDLVDELQVRNLGSFLHCHDKHLSLHTNGHVNNLQELHLEREGLHCGYLSLRHNWNVQHSEEELSLRHLQLEPLGLLELVVVEHRDVHNRGSAPQNESAELPLPPKQTLIVAVPPDART